MSPLFLQNVARRFLVRAAMLAIAFAAVVPAVQAATAIDHLRAFVSDTRTVRAEFTQTTLDKKGRPGQEVQGTLSLSRPGKFRWATEKPYPQLIVSDGARVWFFDPDLDQVIVRSTREALGGTPAALLAGDDAIERTFVLTALPDREDLQWLEARPRDKEAGFTEIRIGFRQGKLAALELSDAFGQKIVTRFTRVDYNPRLDDSLFVFTPPPDADVIGDKADKASPTSR